MLSTGQTAECTETKKINHQTGHHIIKSTVIVDHNKNMGMVDKTDMILIATVAKKIPSGIKNYFFTW